MRGRDVLFFITIMFNCLLRLMIVCSFAACILSICNMQYVSANNQNVQYSYDSLGRISIARYPDGTEIKYQYDADGNVLSCDKVMGQTIPDDKEQTGEKPVGGEQTGEKPSAGENGDKQTGNNQPVISDSPQSSAEDIKYYNQFKKRKPVIKSLKRSKSKKKYYLKVQIKQINNIGIYGENGYQIKYALNSKFKKAKVIKIIRNKRGSITSKKWKVKRRKTYYVKVRAYMKTKTGQTIYSKYSKVKKIKTK
ncbi:MAG: RHS repeat protein [Lachnospiraceae bacterium]|nr:RHS repeat protein [Lachnospiraceae bacterium]